MNYCLNCKTQTPNPKFCKRSCAATYNNSRFPKRKPEGKCAICAVAISSGRTYCKSCFGSKSIKERTLGDLRIGNANSYGYPQIRQDSRRTFLANNIAACRVCGYDKHIDVCHIKPVNEFTDDTLISTINDPKNLVGLCKNHHWELDHGYLQIEDGQFKDIPRSYF